MATFKNTWALISSQFAKTINNFMRKSLNKEKLDYKN